MELEPTAEQRELLVALMRQTEEIAVFLIEPDERIVWHNHAASLIFAREDMRGCASAELFPPEAREQGIPAHEVSVASRLGSARDDRWMQRFSGTRFWATGLLVRVEGNEPGRVAYAKLLRDRTDMRMQLDEALKHAASLQAQRGHQQRAIEHMAHELRNPLAVVSVAAGLIAHPSSTPDRQRDAAGRIEKQVGFMSRLLEQLSDTTRIRTGKVSLKPDRLRLGDVLAEALDSASRGVADARARIEVLVADPDLVICADPVRLQQVLANLLDNALKFTPVPGRIWLRAAKVDAEVVFRIRDEGIGIDGGMLDRIFETFTQVPEAGSQGMGLGLSLVRELVGLHGGSVQAKSRGVGRGAEFIVRLPHGVEVVGEGTGQPVPLSPGSPR